MNLEQLGWNDFFRAEWNTVERGSDQAARVIAQHRELWHVAGTFGESRAEPSGKLRLAVEEGGDWPAVGDWVSAGGESGQGMLVRGVLPRRSEIVRKTAGRGVMPQVLAANVDTILLLMGLDGDFNARRVERYWSQLGDSGSRAVLLLNKADACGDAEASADEIRRSASGLDVWCASALTRARTRRHPLLSGSRPDDRAPRFFGCRKIDASQSAVGRGKTGDGGGPEEGQPGPSYHDRKAAVLSSGRRDGYRCAGFARTAVVARRRGCDAGVRGRRKPCREVPVP